MTQQNAPVLAKHRDEAAKAGGWGGYRSVSVSVPSYKSVEAHAQALANLEAANNRLAEIEAELRSQREWAASLTVTDMNEIVADNGITAGMVIGQEAGERVRRMDRALASGHTPSPCPGCAAKDEAMEAFRREVSDALTEYFKDAPSFIAQLDRFIIPPADPVAEALREALTGANLLTDSELVEHFAEVFAEHGLEIAELKSRPNHGRE